MSKAVEKVTSGQRRRVANVIVKAYDARDGDLIANVCNVASEVFGGNPVSKKDRESIVTMVTKQRNWSEKSARFRQSEIRRVLETYDRLPEAVAAYRAEADGVCNWHDAVKLARLLKKFPVDEAVAARFEKTSKTPKRQMIVLPQDALSDFELAKTKFDVEKPSEVIAAVLHWFAEQQTTAKAA